MVVKQPLFSDDRKICSSGLIVDKLEVYPVVASLEAGHNLVVGRDVMTITLRLEGFYVDVVDVAVICEHDVSIPTMRSYEETSHIISVEFSDVGYLDVHFVGGDGWEGFSDEGLRRWNGVWIFYTFRISGAKALNRLVHVAF